MAKLTAQEFAALPEKEQARKRMMGLSPDSLAPEGPGRGAKSPFSEDPDLDEVRASSAPSRQRPGSMAKGAPSGSGFAPPKPKPSTRKAKPKEPELLQEPLLNPEILQDLRATGVILADPELANDDPRAVQAFLKKMLAESEREAKLSDPQAARAQAMDRSENRIGTVEKTFAGQPSEYANSNVAGENFAKSAALGAGASQVNDIKGVSKGFKDDGIPISQDDTNRMAGLILKADRVGNAAMEKETERKEILVGIDGKGGLPERIRVSLMEIEDMLSNDKPPEIKSGLAARRSITGASPTISAPARASAVSSSRAGARA